MALISKVKSIDVTSSTTIQNVAEALGCNGAMCLFDNVNYGILTMEDMTTIPVVVPPNAGFAIAGIGTDTWTLYKIINGNVVTSENIKTISNKMYYVKHDDYVLFSESSTYFGYGMIKGKDTTVADAPESWAYFTEYSANTSTTSVYIFDKNSTSTTNMNNLVALTNNNNIVILTPMFNPATGWISESRAYFAIERPSAYSSTNTLYDFAMNDKNYALFTCLGTISSAKSMVCFDYTDAVDA